MTGQFLLIAVFVRNPPPPTLPLLYISAKLRNYKWDRAVFFVN